MYMRELVRAWAPLVWLAPGEKFLPLGVPEFLDNVKAGNNHLHTRIDVELLLRNESSFIYGKEPAENVPIYALVKDCTTVDKMKKVSPSSFGGTNEILEREDGGRRRRRIIRSKRIIDPRRPDPRRRFFAVGQDKNKLRLNDDLAILPYENTVRNDLSGNEVVTMRADTIRDGNSIPVTDNRFRKLHFHVTYWMFYPFSEGKAVCVLDLGFFGSWPIPRVGGVCFGSLKEYGNHVGDWEHMSLYFQGDDYPSSMYVSAHDAGAFYRYEKRSGTFVYERQETREGIFQKPIFPERVFTSMGKHPVLFSARGSHGLWTAPGKHKFVRLPRLYDESGFGIAWQTWKRIELLPAELDETSPGWMSFRGKWGNPRSNCHPLVKLGFNICEFVDGPTGIPTKKGRFQC
ncbi:uncharacterized protein [Venturia canescens]|uniref:uncharacterized protein isoform X2 n=2 Tax=Venturia canescens TaxID=32260 RepID=UPI001C9C29B5|nr:uncharacterized protein LOC122407356 isoform X2 [Venturia canescens]